VEDLDCEDVDAAAAVSLTPSQVSRKERMLDFLKRNAIITNIIRLVIYGMVALASVICISLGKEPMFFTNVLTLLMGIICDSPLIMKGEHTHTHNGSPPWNPSPPVPSTATVGGP
jgi:hypothetical protein